MSYNMENLFDTLPDLGTEDYTFLPLKFKGTPQHRLNCAKQDSLSRQKECLEGDWSDEKLNRKLDRLADVIQRINGGRGPDILVVVEVENLNVLKQLNRRLKKSDYQTEVLIEGFDPRGIDIGVLSRFPQFEPAKLHRIAFKPKNEEDKVWMPRSRGILQVNLKLPSGDDLTVFGVHFPSQHNPTYWREQSIDSLNQLLAQLPENRMAVAGGDFNISAEEDFKTGLFRERLGQHWLVSHYIGCGDCAGTHNYRGRWSFLDAILFKKSFGPEGKISWRVNEKSISVPRVSRYQFSPYGTPARFDELSPVGVSDHLPIYGEIIRR